MKFSLGIWDGIFGDKVVLEIPDKTGNIIKQTVTKKWLDKMESEGKISMKHEPTICVHLLDPLKSGPTTDYWTIGKNIDQDMVDKFRDKATNAVYVIIAYQAGSPSTMIVTKKIWDDALKKFSEI